MEDGGRIIRELELSIPTSQGHARCASGGSSGCHSARSPVVRDVLLDAELRVGNVSHQTGCHILLRSADDLVEMRHLIWRDHEIEVLAETWRAPVHLQGNPPMKDCPALLPPRSAGRPLRAEHSASSAGPRISSDQTALTSAPDQSHPLLAAALHQENAFMSCVSLLARKLTKCPLALLLRAGAVLAGVRNS